MSTATKYKDGVLDSTLSKRKRNMSSVRGVKKMSISDKEFAQLMKAMKKVKLPEVSLEEKIEYCNKKYGEGRWYFMTREEIKDQLREDGILQ